MNGDTAGILLIFLLGIALGVEISGFWWQGQVNMAISISDNFREIHQELGKRYYANELSNYSYWFDEFTGDLWIKYNNGVVLRVPGNMSERLYNPPSEVKDD